MDEQLNFSSNLNRISKTNLTDNVIYPLSHQYHYIQYYQQEQQLQLADTSNIYNHPEYQQNVSCQCRCSCSDQRQEQEQQQHLDRHSLPTLKADHQIANNIDGQRVAVIVHRQASGSISSNELNITSDTLTTNLESVHKDGIMPLSQKGESATSLLDHLYEARKISDTLSEPIPHYNNHDSETRDNINESENCNCDLECTCNMQVITNLNSDKINKNINFNNNKKNTLINSEVMLTADEITVSESDNNSATVQRCERNQNQKLKVNGMVEGCDLKENSRTVNTIRTSNRNKKNSNNINSSTNRIDLCADGDQPNKFAVSCLMEKKRNALSNSLSDFRPPLPPRPAPWPQQTLNSLSNGTLQARARPAFKKYVIWCLVCGGFSCILGFLLLGVYFLLHSYKITVGNFETVPTFVPASLLILTGLCVITLARRRNRYNYLLKLSGLCGLISAFTCALVTITTTVMHMSRLQALRECEYAQKTRTCTCYSDYMLESIQMNGSNHGVRLVFNSLSDCGVVHGSLYSYLRIIFGLSVAGVLVAVFSCMLIYQLLNHERKKMYWEQLELRCRSLYTRQPISPTNIDALGVINCCQCCEQCRAHRQAILSSNTFSWNNAGESRFWSTRPPGNLYSPNPGGDHEINQHDIPPSRGRSVGWSWNRLWQRNLPVIDAYVRFQQTSSSPDSQYGFTNNNISTVSNAKNNTANDANICTTVSCNRNSTTGDIKGVADMNMLASQKNSLTSFQVTDENLPYGVWGPPPPYSNPNSTASRGYYYYIQPLNITANCTANLSENNMITTNNIKNNDNTRISNNDLNFKDEINSYNNCHHQIQTLQTSISCSSTPNSLSSIAAVSSIGFCYENDGEIENGYLERLTTRIRGEHHRLFNTLPTRKMKKRSSELGHKSVGCHSQNTTRVGVQQIFSNVKINEEQIKSDIIPNIKNTKYNHKKVSGDTKCLDSISHDNNQLSNIHLNSVRDGCENQDLKRKGFEFLQDPSESEVYFADVSSCCNMSVKNDLFYEESHTSNKFLIDKQKKDEYYFQNKNNNCCNVDYLAQRKNSIRNRLLFPQNSENTKLLVNSCCEENQNKFRASHQKEQELSKDITLQSGCTSLDLQVNAGFTLAPKQTRLIDYDQANNKNEIKENQEKSTNQSITDVHYEVINENPTKKKLTQENRCDSIDTTEMLACCRQNGVNKSLINENYHQSHHAHSNSHSHHSNSHGLVLNWHKDLNGGDSDLHHEHQQLSQHDYFQHHHY